MFCAVVIAIVVITIHILPMLYLCLQLIGLSHICSKVLEFLQPDVLQSQFDLQFRNESMSNPDLEKLAEKVIKYSIKTG